MGIRQARIAWIYLRIAFQNEMQYRANFVLQIFQALVSLGTGLVSLALIYSQTSSLHGWSLDQLIELMGVYTIMGAVVAAVIQPNMQQLMDDIQQGNFDYVLTKPEDAQLLASVRQFQIWQAVDILTGAILMGVGLVRLGGKAGPAQTLTFLVSIVLGAVLIYCFWLILTTIAFWVVRMDQMVDLFEGAYAAGRYPVGIYPTWLRFGLTFLIPVGFAVTVPAQAMTGRLAWEDTAGAAALTLFFIALARVLWRLGLKRYSGASS